jgi:diacylglycerol kinase (ATP)
MNSSPPRLLVLWNASARSGAQRAEDLLSALKRIGVPLIEAPGQDSPATFAEALLTARKAGAERVAVVGGDGTLNCALPSLMEYDLPVLFVPSGTANNSARNLDLPMEIDALAMLAVEGAERRVDVGFANGTPFVTVCGIGLSTLVNATVPSAIKRWLGPLAFLVQLLRVAWKARPFRVRVALADGPPLYLRNVHQVSVVNGRYFATGLSVTEDATLEDGQLDVLCVHFRKWWHGLFYVAMFRRGTASRLTEVTHIRTANATLFCRHRRLDVDGDVKESVPVRFTLKPRGLRVIVPL